MNTFLWVTQAVLAFVLVAHGLVFLFPPAAVRKIKKQMPFPEAFSRFISSAEILAAFGLVLPGWTGLLPWLTPLAATGQTIIMGGAVVFHLSRRELPPALITTILFVLVAFVAYARWVVIPL